MRGAPGLRPVPSTTPRLLWAPASELGSQGWVVLPVSEQEPCLGPYFCQEDATTDPLVDHPPAPAEGAPGTAAAGRGGHLLFTGSCAFALLLQGFPRPCEGTKHRLWDSFLTLPPTPATDSQCWGRTLGVLTHSGAPRFSSSDLFLQKKCQGHMGLCWPLQLGPGLYWPLLGTCWGQIPAKSCGPCPADTPTLSSLRSLEWGPFPGAAQDTRCGICG